MPKRLSLYKSVKTERGWRYSRAAFHSNAKVKPNIVLVNDVEEKHAEESYFTLSDSLIKFAFPNADNIYLHSTPSQALFEENRRDFSHGCIRVEDPRALTTWVLRNNPGWTRERVECRFKRRSRSR